MGNDYKFLKIASIIFKISAYVLPIILVIMAVVIFVGGGTPDAPRITGLVSLVLALVYFFLFFTAAEVIALLLDIHGKVNKGPSA